MFWLTSVAPSFRASNGLVAWSVPTEHRSASSRTGRFTTFLAITWSSANSVGLRTSTIQSHCSTSMESTASIPLNSTRRLGREDIDRMPTMPRQAVLMAYVCISAIRMPALALCGTFVFRMRDGPGGLLQLQHPRDSASAPRSAQSTTAQRSVVRTVGALGAMPVQVDWLGPRRPARPGPRRAPRAPGRRRLRESVSRGRPRATGLGPTALARALAAPPSGHSRCWWISDLPAGHAGGH